MVSDTQTYRDTGDSPVLIIGDSNAFYRQEYGAHIGAHIANVLGFPVSLFAKIGASVGGPEMLKFRSKSFVEKRKVVVWIFASRGLQWPFMAPALPLNITAEESAKLQHLRSYSQNRNQFY